MKLVIIKITAKIINTIANVPEIIFVKYNPAITSAISILIALSAVPIFGFITLCFKILTQIWTIQTQKTVTKVT